MKRNQTFVSLEQLNLKLYLKRGLKLTRSGHRRGTTNDDMETSAWSHVCHQTVIFVSVSSLEQLGESHREALLLDATFIAYLRCKLFLKLPSQLSNNSKHIFLDTLFQALSFTSLIFNPSRSTFPRNSLQLET